MWNGNGKSCVVLEATNNKKKLSWFPLSPYLTPLEFVVLGQSILLFYPVSLDDFCHRIAVVFVVVNCIFVWSLSNKDLIVFYINLNRITKKCTCKEIHFNYETLDILIWEVLITTSRMKILHPNISNLFRCLLATRWPQNKLK